MIKDSSASTCPDLLLSGFELIQNFGFRCQYENPSGWKSARGELCSSLEYSKLLE